MITGATGTATFTPCGTMRSTLTRTWDSRPTLLVVMFNPSTADGSEDDPTVTLLCKLASHNGFGGVVVVNGIPLCSSTPGPAVEMTRWDKHREWGDRDALQNNLGLIVKLCASAGAVLLAWGALADRCADWFDNVREEIECAVPDGTSVYCLGKTTGGYPKHPLARGKHKVRPDQKFVLWGQA